MKPNNNRRSNDFGLPGMSVDVYNNDVNKALRKLKKKIQDDGMLQTLREREHYVKPSEKRAKAKAAGRQRWLKKVAKTEGDVPTTQRKKR